MRAVWQRMRARPHDAEHVLPIPVQAPAMRVIAFVSFHRAVCPDPVTGPRAYTLRAHAQARWRLLVG